MYVLGSAYSNKRLCPEYKEIFFFIEKENGNNSKLMYVRHNSFAVVFSLIYCRETWNWRFVKRLRRISTDKQSILNKTPHTTCRKKTRCVNFTSKQYLIRILLGFRLSYRDPVHVRNRVVYDIITFMLCTYRIQIHFETFEISTLYMGNTIQYNPWIEY